MVVPVLLVAMALIGFWPQYYGRLLAGTALDRGASHFLVPVHTSLFLGWLAILFTQAMFVRAGRVDATGRRVHVVWFIGLAAFTTRLMLELLATLPQWLPVGRALIRPFI